MPENKSQNAKNASVKTEKKTAAARQNAAKATAARRKPLADIPCGCPVSANETNPDLHLKSCLRRRAILRREKQGIPLS